MRSKVKNPAKLKTFPNTNTKSKTKYRGGNKRYNKRQQVVGERDPGNPPPVVTKLLLRQDDGDDDVDGDGDDDGGGDGHNLYDDGDDGDDGDPFYPPTVVTKLLLRQDDSDGDDDDQLKKITLYIRRGLQHLFNTLGPLSKSGLCAQLNCTPELRPCPNQ